jgi:curved DNA-binding protein CbpA
MKDYYKILGVKKTASDEEIRKRWIKLMQKYHPDHTGDGNLNEQRIREMNEAYEILKHSSTRVKYDLRRKARLRKKRKSYLRRLPVPISILIVLLIMGTIYFKSSQVPPASKLISSKVDRAHQRNESSQIDQRSQIDKRDQTVRAPGSEASVEPPKTVLEEVKTMPSKAVKEVKPPEVSQIKTVKVVPTVIKPQPAFMSAPEAEPKPIEKVPEQVSVKSGTPEKAKEVAPKESIKGVEPSPPHPRRDPTDQRDEKNRKDKEVAGSEKSIPKELIQVEETKPPSQEIRIVTAPVSSKKDKTDEGDQKDQRIRIATEEEVKQFFSNYIDRYNHKDIDRFLSFFSVKAIQNHKDGFKKIKTIYTDLFKESQRLFYQLKDQKIGIFSNHAQVRASYEIEQMDRAGDVRLWRGSAEWMLVKEGWDLKISSLRYEHDQVR